MQMKIKLGNLILTLSYLRGNKFIGTDRFLYSNVGTYVVCFLLWTLWQPQVQKSNQNQNYGNPSQLELKQKLLFDLLIYWPSRQKSVLYYGFYHILLIICLQEKTI